MSDRRRIADDVDVETLSGPERFFRGGAGVRGMTFDGRGTAMRVPFGWVSLLAGIIGGFIFIVSLISGRDTPAAFTLLAASVAAFVAGWMACVSIPRLEQRINGTAPGRRVQPPEHAADPEPDATADGGGK